MATTKAENAFENLVLFIGGTLIAGLIFGYAFTHGARAAGCLPLSTTGCGGVT